MWTFDQLKVISIYSIKLICYGWRVNLWQNLYMRFMMVSLFSQTSLAKIYEITVHLSLQLSLQIPRYIELVESFYNHDRHQKRRSGVNDACLPSNVFLQLLPQSSFHPFHLDHHHHHQHHHQQHSLSQINFSILHFISSLDFSNGGFKKDFWTDKKL